MVPFNKYTLIFKQETVDEEINIKNIEEPLIVSFAHDKFDDSNSKYSIFLLLVNEMAKYFVRELREKIDVLSKLQK